MFFLNWKKLRSPARATFKNPKISLLIGKNLEDQYEKYQPMTIMKNTNFKSVDDLGKIISYKFHC